jgi:hypothetical protein
LMVGNKDIQKYFTGSEENFREVRGRT